MLISTWLTSLRNRLHPGNPRRPNRLRHSPESAARALEHLESRHLLAAPQLIDVQDEAGRVIVEDSEISTSPTEFRMNFSSTPNLDPATVGGSFTLERAGQDGAFDGNDVQVPLSFAGIGSQANQVLLQVGQPLPTDLYRINIAGTLANLSGETFNNGVPDTFGFSIQLPPPSLVAVRPNVGEFLRDGDTRHVAPNELTLQFNPGQVIDPLSVNTSTVKVQRAGHDGTFDDGNEQFVNIGFVGIGDVPEEVVVRFAENLPDDDYRILLDGTSPTPISSVTGETLNNGSDTEFHFSLDLGARVIAVDPQPVVRNPDGTISQQRDQIVLYFNDDDMPKATAENTAFYQLIFTNDTVTNLDDNDLDGNPATPPQAVHPLTAVYDADKDTVTLTFDKDIHQIAGAGTYRLRVGTNEAIPLPPVQTTFGPTQDPGDSFDSPTVGNLGDLSLAGNTGYVVSSSIDPQPLPIVFPGAISDPGHRDIEIETHLDGGADATDGVTQFDYNFQDFYGFDPAGNILRNTITEGQKQRAREVFEYYSVLTGLDFRETANSGFTIATGDLRAIDPTVPTGPGGVTGIADPMSGVAIMDRAETWDESAGGNWFQTAMHEIGHLLFIGHSSELAPVTVNAGDGYGNTNPGAFNGLAEPVFPGDHDLVHLQHLHRPDGRDIDMYKFNISATGLFTAEVMAERLADSSYLDSYVRLYRENPDGSRSLLAQNDDYFSEDSYLELQLTPGTYFIGVSSTGNDNYNPVVPGTGIGGTSEGAYDLRLNFRPNITQVGSTLTDLDGTAFDGDSDGNPGGVYNFWFRATAPTDTLFVDKEAADKGVSGRLNDGSEASPFLEIDQALAAARPGQTVRIVGNGGADDDVTTIADNTPYLIGNSLSNTVLPDGPSLDVPKDVTVMIDAGAVIKLRDARLAVGSSTAGTDRSGGALQVLGTPENRVIFTSLLDETIGTDTTSTPTSPAPGNWGGLVFQNDIDRAEGRFNYQSRGIFLNYVGQADILYGGGNVVVDSVSQPVNPIHITSAQPTIVHNLIRYSQDSAISADPDSFEEVTFHAPRFQEGAQLFTSDYQRIGPDIYWNTLTDNSTNGLFVRVQTLPGLPIEKLTVPGRFDDTDIVHVIAQNLEIQGTPGGPVLDATSPDIALVVVSARNVVTGSLGAGSYNYRLVYVDQNGFESPPSPVTATVTVSSGTSNSVLISGLPTAPPEYAGRRIYRSDNTGSGTYSLVAELGRSESVFLDIGQTFERTLDTSVTSRNRARFDARLTIDPGVVVKLEGSRIEAEVGAQLIAEGQPGREIIFTSRLDDRYGAGGTFDTNDDGDLVSPRTVYLEDNFESGLFDPARWAPTTNAAIDTAGLAESSGSFSAHLRPGTQMQTATVNLFNQPALDLEFTYQRTGSGSAPDAPLTIQYRNSSGVWVTLQTFAANGPDMTTFDPISVRLPGGATHVNSAFRFAFGTPGGNTGSAGDWFVDDVRIVEARINAIPSAGNWGGLYVGHLGSASIDQALITFGGGVIPVENDFSGFNALEIHQAKARVANTVFEENADGTGGSAPAERFGLFENAAGTIFVRGAQPVILDNDFRNNAGAVISINVNALNSNAVGDFGRSTGAARADLSLIGNQGPLIHGNRMGGNDINGMVVRAATLTTQSVWDDTDIVHVLTGDVLVPDFHTYGGLRLESSGTESLVVKLQGPDAGFTASGYPIDIDDRIGGAIQIVGQPGQPVVLTSLSDDSVGAGFDLRGFPLRDTNNDGFSTGSPGDWRSVRIDQFAHDRNVRVVVENEVASSNSPDINKSVSTAQVLGLLARDEKSGDETLRLGFEVHGVIDSNNDQDIYSFEAEAGTHVWLDIDRTSIGFDSVVELLDSSGNIVAQSDNTLDELNGVYPVFSTGGANAQSLNYSQFFTSDLYSLNTTDAGMRVTLPGAVGVRQSYFVRVRSSNLNASFAPTELFSDNFESGVFDPTRWATVNFATIDGLGENEPSGVLSARLNSDPAGGDLLQTVDIDLSAAPAARLTYSFQRTGGGDSPEVGEDLVLSYRNSGGAWVELERQLGAGADQSQFQKSIVILPADALHAGFALRFQTTSVAGGTTDDWFVDDVVIESLPTINRTSLQSNASVGDGLTAGSYQLQIRLQDVDEFPGSQVTYADVRYASTGIEVLGQPIHGLLTGEAAEAGSTTVLPNVLNTDRAAISISGNLDISNQDIDFYQFELRYDVTQAIAGDGDDTAHVPVTFDIDYADGFARANTTIAIFNQDNQLILIGRDSNISDDQPKIVDGVGDSVADVDDIRRGSVGKTDAFIGPVELISGTYTLAVFNNDSIPAVLDQYSQLNPTSRLIRLEPVNSTTRIAEERFNDTIVFDPVTGEISVADIPVTSASAPITNLFEVGLTGQLEQKHLVPFHLGDVTMFVSRRGATKSGDKTAIYTVDPFTGATETEVGGFNVGIGDVAMRADGQLHAFSTEPPGNTVVTDGNVGNYLRIDTGNANVDNIGDDGVVTQIFNNGAAAGHDVGIQYNAMTYTGTSAGNNLADLWAVGNRTTTSLKQGQQGIVAADYVTNILYNLNLASGAVDGDGNDRTGNNGFSATDGAGTPQREHGFIDTTFANGGLQGTVTGIVSMGSDSTFYVVDDAGGLYRVDRFGGFQQSVDPNSVLQNTFFNSIRTTFIRNIGADDTGVGGLNLNFQGLTRGPENVEGGLYSQVLFGITGEGDIYAFDTTGELQPVFVDGQTSISTGLTNANGLAFGTLDYNLWHVTDRRGGLTAADDGHGIDVATFDNSVFLPEPGGSSLYFGFEDAPNTPDPSFGGRTQSGNKNTAPDNSIQNAVVNNINFPGGAHGSVVSNEFSLEGYSSADKPVLYFNYWLETENTNYDPTTNPVTLMRDAFRVFVQDESGQWRLVSTNDSFQDSERPDEFDIGHQETLSDGLSNNPSRQTFPDVVETFDNAGWRQARIDLSNYAGQSGLKLRFDFSTAGSMNVGDLSTTGIELYAVDGTELTDGDSFTLADVDQFGFPTNVQTFEFDLGAHLTLPSGNAAIGQSFTVTGPGFSETFTYTETPTGPNDILALSSDSASVLAQRTNEFLNNFFGGNNIQLADGASLQNETFRYGGQVFTFTDNPLLPTDILAEPGDSAATIAARAAQVVNAVLGAGSAFPNGDALNLFVAGGGTVEFGGVLHIVGANFLEGESFTVLGQTFTFTANPKLASDIDILTNATDAAVAQATVNVINTVLGAGTAIYDALAPTRVTVPDIPTTADAFVTGGTLYLTDVDTPSDYQLESFTIFGTTFTFTDNPTRANDILAQAGDTADVIAARVRAVLDATFGPGVVLPVDPLAPERVSVPNIPTFSDSFLRGGTLVIQNVSELDNYEFELNGVTFRFTDNPTQSTDILARRTDSALAVAAETVRIINNTFGVGTAFQDLERVHIPDLSSAFAGIYHGARLNFDNATPQNMEGDSFTVFDTTFTFTRNPLFTSTGAVDIAFNDNTTPDDFVTLAAAAINNALAADGLAPRATAVTTTSGVGELIGIDFGPAGDNSPSNWNQSDGNAGIDYRLTNLRDELGNTSLIDVDVIYSAAGTGGTVANSPNVANLPSHTNPLDNVDGALRHDAGVTFQFSDLDPGATYQIYVFGGDTATTGSQDVSVFGTSATSFTQAWNNNLFVNDQPSANVALDTFAVNAVATSTGLITLQVSESSPGDEVVIPAIAIRKIANPAYVEIAGTAAGFLGTSMTINGPDANAINGDTLDVSFFTFTYVGNAPANIQQIQSDNSQIVTANNTVTALNNAFNTFGLTWRNAFRTGRRVSIPAEAEINYTDSGPNGSITVSDYARLQITPFDDVQGDVLTYRGFSFTFTDTTTPAIDEIGSDGLGNWDGDDIVAAINRVFGAGESFNNAGEVFFYQDPSFFGPLLTYTDPGGDGLTILDDGSGGNPFFFQQISRPLQALLLSDEVGSPMTVDPRGTTLVHDAVGTAIVLVPGGPSVWHDNRVTIRSATGLTTSGTTLITSGQAGDNGTGFPTILIDPTMSEQEVAIAIRQGLADVYANGDINAIKGYENLIRIINHDVVDPGPLQMVNALPGDEFGAFTGTRFPSLRGMNNDVEGVYVDDIIIGFAERGEMVTNAPLGNSNFIQNPDVDDTRPVAAFNQLFEPNTYIDILNGPYDLEIRTSSQVGESQTADPTQMLMRTLDTNDREVNGVAVTMPAAVDIPDRSTFSVSNGINTVNFQFVDTRGANLAPDPGHIAIFYEPIFGMAGTGQDSREDIARRVAAAINSQAAQDALSPQQLTDDFGVQAMYSDSDDIVTSSGSSATLHLTGNVIIETDPTLAQLFDITVYNLTGDANRKREQGQVVIDSSFVTHSSGFGIVVDNGTRSDGLPHPGSVRTTQEINTQRLVPGVVVTNNVVAENLGGGILYSGDAGTNPDGVSPVGRIVNNTVYGTGTATGIVVNDGASPTLLNNIVANFGTGINVGGGASAIIGSTLYQNNGVNSNAGLGTFPIVLGANEPLFVDAAAGNFYPAPSSRAIDSSLETLADHPEIVRVKTPLGGGLSPLVAPKLDVFGQVRGDDAAVATPSGQGGNVFLDRGAVDRVDFFAPIAVLSNPEDGSAADIDPDPAEIWVNLPEDLREFRVRLVDQGIGIDDTKVNPRQFTLSQDGVDLIEGVHYVWAYNSVTNEVIFTAVTSFEFERRYTIRVENQPLDPANPNSIEGVQDLAGNFLAANQTDGSTVFQILVTDGVNDPPINSVPGTQTINEGDTLVFSDANGNAITVSDADVHLADNPTLNVTLTTTQGLLTLGDTTGLVFPTGDSGSNEASITFTGSVTDINNALNGLRLVPDPEYFNLLPGQDPASRTIPPISVTITTDDTGPNGRGQFTGPPNDAPETDVDVILVNVISVNDPPTFNPPADPSAVDEDTPGLQTVPGFVTGMSPGPANESSQTFAFSVQAPVIVSGNLVFLQNPQISVTGDLTYEIAPNTNGVAQFTFVLQDFDSTDPNHMSASSLPHTATLVVNPINDEPFFTLNSNTVTVDEDAGLVGPISLINTVAVGPVDATDETTLPATRQTPTFEATSPVVTSGNLVFTSFAVSAAGDLTFTAAPNTAGTATFQIRVLDDGPSSSHPLDDNVSDYQTVNIAVNPRPDPPVPVTGDYVIDDGDPLSLDGSASTDPDLDFAGTATETLSYSWDVGGDGTFEVVNSPSPFATISYSTLASLGLNIPGDNDVVLRVTDVFSGTSVDAVAKLTIHTVDYGHAPDVNYRHLKLNNGPAHTIQAGFFLGSGIDAEFDGPADDAAEDDGIVFDPAMQADSVFALDSFFTATASAAGKLDVWIDFNNDGDFDANEHLNGGVSYDVVAGQNQFTFTIPAGAAVTGVDTWARARLTSTGGAAPTGRLEDGEVEDYQLRISPLLPAEPLVHVLPMWSQTSDLTPLLQWAPNPGTPGANVTYNIELRNAAGQVVGFQENHPTTSISLSDPLPPGSYTAFVTAFNRAGQAGPTSQLNTFEVVAIAVTSPAGDITSARPTIEWTPVDRTDHYELEVQSALTGAVLVSRSSIPGNTTSYTLTSDLPIGDYRVRVRAVEHTTGQVGDWSVFQFFNVRTAPVVTAPVGTISDPTPQVTWNGVPGAATYDVRLNAVTDNVSPLLTLTGVTGLSADISQALGLGEYTVEVRGVTSQNFTSNWSTPASFVVAIPPVISQPSGRQPDSTPTIVWSPVNGADNYDVEIVDTVNSQIVYTTPAGGITGTQHTVPQNRPLALGTYEVRVRANNVPTSGSSGGTVSALSTPSLITVSTPPEVLLPHVGIYDTTPEITWTAPFGAQTAEIEIVPIGSQTPIFTASGIPGTSFTIPAGSALPPGGYSVRIRSFGGSSGVSASDWSTPHIFNVGAAPVALGPSEGLGSAPFRKTVNPRPTLTAQQSLSGVTHEFWLTDVSNNRTLFTVQGLQSTSWTVPANLPVGHYRYWVRATTDVGERSAWSTPFDFDIVTPPVVAPMQPTFNTRPVIRWNVNNQQPEIDSYRVWLNKVDEVPARIILVEPSVVDNQFQVPQDLEWGRYKVWVDGVVEGTNPRARAVRTVWSQGVEFEVGGRPIPVSLGNITDDTPLLEWSEVEGAAFYEIYLALESSFASPIVRQSNISSTSFQVTQPLQAGNYIWWVRAHAADGRKSPWSLNRLGRFSVQAVTTPVLNQIPTGSNPHPTFSWTPATGAVRYRLYVAPVTSPSNPIIDEQTTGPVTSWVSATPLPPNTYRVWVQAILSSGNAGPWSAPVTFAVTAAHSPETPEFRPHTMLATLSVPLTEVLPENVTVSQALAEYERAGVSAEAVDLPSVAVPGEVPPVAPVTQHVDSEDSADTDADLLMKEWDAEIWAAESGTAIPETLRADRGTSVSQPDSEKADSRSWLAGLAMLTPAFLRRRRQDRR